MDTTIHYTFFVTRPVAPFCSPILYGRLYVLRYYYTLLPLLRACMFYTIYSSAEPGLTFLFIFCHCACLGVSSRHGCDDDDDDDDW